jgi:hypothetical protein
MATPEPGRQTTFILPHFDYEVPLLMGADGHHYVPLFVLCRLLGLDASRELRCARHKLLWDSARLFHVRWNGASYFAWCQPYPLGLASWLGAVEYQRIQDPDRRAQLHRTVQEGMELWGRTWDVTRDRFEQGRKRIYHLSQRMTEVGEVLHHLQQHAPWPSADVQRQIEQLALRQQVLADQVQTFVRAWLADKADLPVIDALRLDEAGNVLDESVPMTLFGTMTRHEEARLSHYNQAYMALVADVLEVLHGLEP